MSLVGGQCSSFGQVARSFFESVSAEKVNDEEAESCIKFRNKTNNTFDFVPTCIMKVAHFLSIWTIFF